MLKIAKVHENLTIDNFSNYIKGMLNSIAFDIFQDNILDESTTPYSPFTMVS